MTFQEGLNKLDKASKIITDANKLITDVNLVTFLFPSPGNGLYFCLVRKYIPGITNST
ncbi:hypothetical protein [Cytobacillus pseudoceanisediminis]|uniref:hypothetical protein n=1 Tax=Cytobacillus pseudoceanisediminis TaxID=3051614 RepID=UPI003C2D27E7